MTDENEPIDETASGAEEQEESNEEVGEVEEDNQEDTPDEEEAEKDQVEKEEEEDEDKPTEESDPKDGDGEVEEDKKEDTPDKEAAEKDEAQKEEEEDDPSGEEPEVEYVFEGRNPRLIKADVSMISGCMDRQTSMDLTLHPFKVHDPAGLQSGALTGAMLEVLGEFVEKDDEEKESRLAFVESLRSKITNKADVPQLPQFSASTKKDMSEPFDFIPSSVTGTKRAIVIGINYVGTRSALSGCHNDAQNVKHFLVEKQGFKEEDIVMIMDDGEAINPSKWNILSELNKLVVASQSGDFLFMHYSGHGMPVPDHDGDERDGYDEALLAASGGGIVDDELFENVVTQLKEGVTMFGLFDCCMSGTILDLPYRLSFKADLDAKDERVPSVSDEATMQTEGQEEGGDDAEVGDEDQGDLDDQMMLMTSMLLMMQVNRKMGKNKTGKMKDKLTKMLELMG